MARASSENRRKSTIVRYNNVHDEYDNVIKELGKYAALVPKSYIYERISEKTGLCCKSIARVRMKRGGRVSAHPPRYGL